MEGDVLKQFPQVQDAFIQDKVDDNVFTKYTFNLIQ